MKNEGRGIQSIEVGARMLSVLIEHDEPMLLKDLARQAELAPAQAHAYLVSFRKLGLIEQVENSKQYRLGPLGLDLSITRMRTVDPFRLAGDAALELSNKTSLTVALIVWGAYGPTVVQVYEGSGQIHINTRVGTVYSLTGTASGRAFAAFMPDSVIKKFMKTEKREEHTGLRVGKPKFLSRQEIKRIQAQGYGDIDTPPIPNITGISAPVFGQSKQMQFALTLVGPEHLLENRGDNAYVEALLETTKGLSRNLGCEEN